jgi:hypothetical protein
VAAKRQSYFGELMLVREGVILLCRLLKTKKMNWDKRYQKIYAREGEDVIVSFKMVVDKEIKEIVPSCNCTSYTFKDNILKTTVSASPVKVILPKKAYEEGIRDYTTRKHFKVNYADGTAERLIFEVIVNE